MESPRFDRCVWQDRKTKNPKATESIGLSCPQTPSTELAGSSPPAWQSPAQYGGLKVQLLWRSLLNVPEQDRDAQFHPKKPSATTRIEFYAGSLAAPNPTFRTVSSSFCLFSLAACSSFICLSSSSCSASSFWRSSFRFCRASLWGGGLPTRSRFTVVWMAGGKRTPWSGMLNFLSRLCEVTCSAVLAVGLGIFRYIFESESTVVRCRNSHQAGHQHKPEVKDA